MQVRFLVDYRGELTAEQFYTAGTVASFDDATAAQLIADGRAAALVTGVDPAQGPDQTVVVELPPSGSPRRRRRSSEDEG